MLQLQLETVITKISLYYLRPVELFIFIMWIEMPVMVFYGASMILKRFLSLVRSGKGRIMTGKFVQVLP